MNPLSNLESPYYLTSGDLPAAQMVVDRLTREGNYVTWASAMRISLTARRKVNFINGKITKPIEHSTKEFEIWEIVNELVMAWLINAVSSQIASTIIRLETAYQAWMDLEGRYNQLNAPRTSQVKFQLNNLRQGNLTVTEYFDKFKVLWEQLIDIEQCHIEQCHIEQLIYEGKQERDRIHQFILGLNENLRTIRSHILSLEQMPNMSKIFCLVVQEEKQKNTFTENIYDKTGGESSVFYAKSHRY